MDLADILQMGAKIIQNNDDDSTTGLDIGDIASALSGVLGGDSADGNGNNISSLVSLVSSLSDSGLKDVVNSWLGDGENEPIDADSVSNVLGEDKINQFAEQLGISPESASKALADVLPSIVDKASSAESNILGDLLSQVGGIGGAISIISRFLK
jgi:uncharacterized protein YidB (DUF937 family)